jgi:hypothetical protein
VLRLAFLTEKLSIDAGELTDKGVLNQRHILRRHSALVEQNTPRPRRAIPESRNRFSEEVARKTRTWSGTMILGKFIPLPGVHSTRDPGH